jgi:hypothetical protein
MAQSKRLCLPGHAQRSSQSDLQSVWGAIHYPIQQLINKSVQLLITGKLHLNEGYYFSYETPDLQHPAHIYYTSFRDSIHTAYCPVWENAYAYKHSIGRKLAESIQPTLRKLSAKEFAKLCKWTHESLDFQGILLLILESMKASLLFMPAGLSVALESLTDFLVKKDEEKVLPMKKQLARKVRDELFQVIEKYKNEIEEEGIATLTKRIENINQLTNRNRLVKPFERLGFQLTEEDKKAIEHRNDFLHGKLTLKSDLLAEEDDRDVYYIALRLYTLLSVLILKSIGYDNKIVNYPKIHERTYNRNVDESPFRQI